MDGSAPGPAYLAVLGCEISFCRDGKSAIVWRPSADLTNTAGVVQGGFVSAVLDLTSAVAAATAHDQTADSASVRVAVEFFRPARAGHEYRVEGVVVNKSKRWITCDATVIDADGKMLARVQHLIALIQKVHAVESDMKG
jgi:uncharacterized protein (TIGR00369 family)